ncbi:hypothetical protein KJ644_05280 [Candidatus Dependentiae bacterium]|nr:hypothetical protein [Candidatus Dependentiae bacterium]
MKKIILIELIVAVMALRRLVFSMVVMIVLVGFLTGCATTPWKAMCGDKNFFGLVMPSQK